MAEWRSLLERSDPFLESVHCAKLYAASYGITVLDVLGYTFEDAVVSWLEGRLTGLEVKNPPAVFYF